ncbi:MAG TPA: hypothetical protein VHE30_22355 [Polyangiaceae bacterium]|nr:hypothetical protein [Polyangiaceae bacterium]
MLAAAENLSDALLVSLGEGIAPVALEELGKAENRVERRAKLVAHRREEVALRRARGFSRRSRLLELLRTAFVLRQIPDQLDDAALRGPAVRDAQGPPVPEADVERAGRFQSSASKALSPELLALGVVGKVDVVQPLLQELPVRLADEIARGALVEQAPVHAVAQDEPVLGVEQREGVLDALDGAREPIRDDACRRLQLLPLRDVPDGCGDGRAASAPLGAQADLDRNLARVLPATEQLETGAHGASRRPREIPAHLAGVRTPEPFRDEQLERLPDELVPAVAEERLRLDVHELNPSVLADDDQGVGSAVQELRDAVRPRGDLVQSVALPKHLLLQPHHLRHVFHPVKDVSDPTVVVANRTIQGPPVPLLELPAHRGRSPHRIPLDRHGMWPLLQEHPLERGA